jgi:hypothetical protein
MQPDSAENRNSIAESILEGSGADEDEDVVLDANGVCNDEPLPDLVEDVNTCDGKPETGNRKIRAQFGRKRTHNEQLCVGSCGVILGRATFYGSEAPNGVRVRFYTFIDIKPNHPFYRAFG